MSIYLISDIHGNNTLFRKALKSIRFKKQDKLIVLGDMIDRGMDSKGVLDTIFLLLEHGFDVKCIKGNHEQMFLDSFNDVTEKVKWIKNGGDKTLSSFLTSDLNSISSKYINFIKSLENYITYEDYIFVHAGIDMTKNEPLEDEKSLLWLRDWEKVYDRNWLGERKVVHGHSPKSQQEIVNQFKSDKKVYCIDNGTFLNDRLGYGAICVLKLDNLSLHFEN